ncbi:hypothetical protein BH23CHL2_BH23CHL2_19740 [soil metagenome]
MTIQIRPGKRNAPIRITENRRTTGNTAIRSALAIRPNRTLWQRAGWQRSNEGRGVVYRGRFRIWDKRGGIFRHYAGRIETGEGNSRIFVHDPPEALIKRHPARWCLAHIKDGWYRLNWRRGTGDIDLSLAFLEKLLDEALNGRRNRR